MAILEQLLQ